MITTTLYLLSGALSLLGNAVMAVVLPLIVLDRTGSAAAAGTLALAVAVPTVLAAVIGGVVIDRVDRRLASIVSDLISAGSVALLPIVDRLAGLDLGWFIVLGIIGAIGDAPGVSAREALLPAIARHGRQPLRKLVSLRESIAALTIVLGPGLAGVLISRFDSTTVLWITATTSALAALTTACLPRLAPDPEAVAEAHAPVSVGGLIRETTTGLRFLVGQPLLRAVTILSLFVVAVLGALQGILMPVLFTERGQPERLGTILTALAIGSLVGALAYGLMRDRLAPRLWWSGGMVGLGCALVVMTQQPDYIALLLAAVALGIMSGPVNAILGVATIEATPDHLRGRINSTQTGLILVAAPVAIFGIGLMISNVSLAAAGHALSIATLAGIVYALTAPALRRLVERAVTAPTPDVAPPVADV
jgi:MFS family permease